MTDKFDIKDYFNYSISGFLWILIISNYLIYSSVIKYEIVIGFLKEQTNVVYIALVLLFGSYIIGNVLRFSENLLIKMADFLFGDFYSSALYVSDKEQHYSWKHGLLYSLCKKKKPLRIGKTYTEEIEKNLLKYKITNTSKKDQFIMCETYLLLNHSNLKYQRLKDLKNLYESISLPFIIISIWSASKVIEVDLVAWYNKIFIVILLICIVCKFFDRYRYLKSNYIKNVYRYFVFNIEKETKKN